MRRVLVTGATGFVGKALCGRMTADGWNVHAAIRSERQSDSLSPGVEAFTVGSIGQATDWDEALEGVDTVIHLAAAVPREGVDGRVFTDVNVLGTSRLAEEAAARGVRRFVYLSSIEVHGTTANGKPFTEEDEPLPQTSYGASKMKSESELLRISGETGLEVVILRSPLVYGPGKTGSIMGLIISLLKKNLPLPFASVHNQRSFIYIGNLLDAIVSCCVSSVGAVNIFLVSDGPTLSTPELILLIADEMKKKPGLISFPVSWLKAAGRISRKGTAIRLLTDSYYLDNSKIMQEVGWNPPFTVEEGIRATIASAMKN